MLGAKAKASTSNAIDMYRSTANAANCFSKWSFESNVRQDSVTPTTKNNKTDYGIACAYIMSYTAVFVVTKLF